MFQSLAITYMVSYKFLPLKVRIYMTPGQREFIAIYTASPSDQMQDNMFEKWFEQFLDSIKKLKLTLPALLI